MPRLILRPFPILRDQFLDASANRIVGGATRFDLKMFDDTFQIEFLEGESGPLGGNKGALHCTLGRRMAEPRMSCCWALERLRVTMVSPLMATVSMSYAINAMRKADLVLLFGAQNIPAGIEERVATFCRTVLIPSMPLGWRPCWVAKRGADC